MVYVLFILFVAFLVFGIWRATVITLSVQDGRLPDVYMAGQGGGLPLIDVLKAAGKTR